MDLSLHRLRMLRELHRRGTVTAAATALHYTASAVSQQLAQLERDVGARLFERIGRRVQLTDLGSLLAEHAEEILGAVDRASLALEEAQEAATVRLRAGVFATVAAGLLPRAMDTLAGRHPGLQLRTRELPPEATALAVREGELDLAFVIDYPDAPMQRDPSLLGSQIAVERLHVAVPAGSLGAGPVALSDLAEQTWILSGPKSHFGAAVRAACQRAGFDLTITHEVDEQATAMSMVASGMGITLVSDLGLQLRPPGMDALALTVPITRTVSIVYRSTALRRPALNLVIDVVRATAVELGLSVANP
ncbi:LysR substrate-binding domain-containing protein [Haloechinothrix sp. LS1_15]|uniref:LysR family transcriptional regulator n=1 Tax=Haloechinothrix sp. LS1_15 TaxID=2652248 RepID=UPI002946C1A8|nr:LysR substrate-binding domain-containing protein [Haloechinothrix sp. LS1_15]MDV6014634.1 LysR family transcriptional regulator [Haloechinothrix sp. LS1_15]